MSSEFDISRRAFLGGIAQATIVLSGATLAACGTANGTDRQLRFASLDEALAELDRRAGTAPPAAEGAWPWRKVLAHCAQSIEYSMSGFPQSKPALFQNTVGSAAFAVFAWRGRMSHGLTEAIPGAPALDEADGGAETRLRQAIASFRAHEGPLRPHFAYGDLDKSEYELAHAMHLANHFSAFPA